MAENSAEQRNLLAGKRGIIMGVANDHSIAWGVASAARNNGAEIILTAQQVMASRVAPLAKGIGAHYQICDVEVEGSVRACFAEVNEKLGGIDFVVHAIAYSDRNELKGRYCDTTRDNFVRTMLTSCFSFTEVAREASQYMPSGGSLLTLTYDGSRRVYPSYNVMGLAKAGLEASVRYLAVDFGNKNIRVNAISAGPMRTLAGAGISGARAIMQGHRSGAPLGRSITLRDIGGAASYLLSDLASGVTGEIHYVDAGYSVTAMPRPKT